MGVQSSLHTLLNILIKSVCCQGNDRNCFCIVPLKASDRPRRFQTIHFRHTHIHQNSIIVSSLVAFKQINGLFTIFSQIRFYLTHGEHHNHNLSVHSYIFCEQHSAAFQICCSFCERFILASEHLCELIHYCTGKKRFRHERIYSRLMGFISNFIPIE